MTGDASDPRLRRLTADQRATLAAVNRSHELDATRWTVSYRDHTATALHRRARAAGNGHP